VANFGHQTNGIEDPEINPHSYSHLILNDKHFFGGGGSSGGDSDDIRV
jgi:hypothetical protein